MKPFERNVGKLQEERFRIWLDDMDEDENLQFEADHLDKILHWWEIAFF